MLTHATASRGCVNIVRVYIESWLAEKFLAAPGRQTCINSMLDLTLSKLSFIPALICWSEIRPLDNTVCSVLVNTFNTFWTSGGFACDIFHTLLICQGNKRELTHNCTIAKLLLFLIFFFILPPVPLHSHCQACTHFPFQWTEPVKQSLCFKSQILS